jgi:hypothetical protein
MSVGDIISERRENNLLDRRAAAEHLGAAAEHRRDAADDFEHPMEIKNQQEIEFRI